jgi:hypothetical protein
VLCRRPLALCLHLYFLLSPKRKAEFSAGVISSRESIVVISHQLSPVVQQRRPKTRVYRSRLSAAILGPGTERNCQSAKTHLQQPPKTDWIEVQCSAVQCPFHCHASPSSQPPSSLLPHGPSVRHPVGTRSHSQSELRLPTHHVSFPTVNSLPIRLNRPWRVS